MIRYITEIRPEARQIYDFFSLKPGSEHISSPIGLHVLLNICEEAKPKHILEIGAGIGTISYLLLKYTDAHIDMFENNDFCLQQLRQNLVQFDTKRYTLLTDYDNFILPDDSYDLMVVDGGSSDFLREVIRRTKRIGRIFVEGNRGERRKVMRLALAKKYIFTPREYRDANGVYKGAHEMLCYSCRSVLLRSLVYFYWEIRIFKEIRFFLKYRWSWLLKKFGWR